jgi:hypothetical protein
MTPLFITDSRGLKCTNFVRKVFLDEKNTLTSNLLPILFTFSPRLGIYGSTTIASLVFLFFLRDKGRKMGIFCFLFLLFLMLLIRAPGYPFFIKISSTFLYSFSFSLTSEQIYRIAESRNNFIPRLF